MNPGQHPRNKAPQTQSLSGLTPYEDSCKIWTSKLNTFVLNPIHKMPGQNT